MPRLVDRFNKIRMANDEQWSPGWLDRVLSALGSVFAGPEAVAQSPESTLEQEIAVLRSREYDAAELAVAEDIAAHSQPDLALPCRQQT